MNINEIKTSGNITEKNGGKTRRISFAEPLTPDLFFTQSPELQNYICHLASAQAFISVGERFIKLAHLPIDAVAFPEAMLDFIKWGHAHRRGQSAEKLALDAAENSLERLEKAFDAAFAVIRVILDAGDYANPELPSAHAAMKTAEAARDAAKLDVANAKAAHEAALAAAAAARPKKPKKDKPATPIDGMTAEQITAELAALDADATKVAQH